MAEAERLMLRLRQETIQPPLSVRALVFALLQNLEQNAVTARVLSDALPFIQAHADRTIVIKYGGHAMEDEEASLSFAQDVVMLKQVLYGIEVHDVRSAFIFSLISAKSWNVCDRLVEARDRCGFQRVQQ